MEYYVQELDRYAEIYTDPIKSIDDYLQNLYLDSNLIGIRFLKANGNDQRCATNWMGNSYTGQARTSEGVIDFSQSMTIQQYMEMRGIEPSQSVIKQSLTK